MDAEALKQEEIKNITSNEEKEDVNKEIYDLEKLILEGENAKIPVTIDYPTKDGKTVTVSALLKPLTDIEIQNAIRAVKKNKGTTFRNEILKRGLYTIDDKPFPMSLIKIMYGGVTAQLADKISELSGVPIDKEKEEKMMEDLVGF